MEPRRLRSSRAGGELARGFVRNPRSRDPCLLNRRPKGLGLNYLWNEENSAVTVGAVRVCPLIFLTLAALGAAPFVRGQASYEGQPIGSNEIQRTWRRSGGCNIANPAFSSSSTSSSELIEISDIPSAFSCDPHRFEQGMATIEHAPATVKARLNDPAVAPPTVNIVPGLAVKASISGNARFESGGDPHRVHIRVSTGGGSVRDCSDSDSYRTSSATGRVISASIDCAATRLDVIASTVEIEEVNGEMVVTKFVARLTTEAVVIMDHGNSGNLGIANGAEYRVAVSRRYEFLLSEEGDRDQDPPPPNPYRPLPPSDTNFVTEMGEGLDTGCTFREDGPLRINVPINRVVGAAGVDGKLRDPELLVRQGFLTPTATLRLAVWDVDDGADLGEIDTLQINGHFLGSTSPVDQSHIRGGNKRWKVNQFEVPIEHVRFGTVNTSTVNGQQSPPSPGRNEIVIDIDFQHPTGEGVWCTSVDWASLSFGAMAPLALVHGTNAQQSTWELAIRGPSPVDYLTALGIPFEHRINLQANGSPDANARLLHARLIEIARVFGVGSLHLVTHSKGATDSRRMLHAYYQEGNPIRILSLFSIGTPSKGTVLSSAGLVAEDSQNLNEALSVANDPDVRAALKDAYLGNWAGWAGLAPVDPARAAQTPEGMRAFNAQTPKRASVPYFSIAGAADENGNDIIEFQEADGMFPGFAPEGVQQFVGTRIHRFLGRTKALRIESEPAGLIGSLLGVTPLASLVNYNLRDSSILSADAEPNDLVSTAASTHCTECGFVPLVTYPHNHSALKRPRTIDRILDEIRKLYPIGLSGGSR